MFSLKYPFEASVLEKVNYNFELLPEDPCHWDDGHCDRYGFFSSTKNKLIDSYDKYIKELLKKPELLDDNLKKHLETFVNQTQENSKAITTMLILIGAIIAVSIVSCASIVLGNVFYFKCTKEPNQKLENNNQESSFLKCFNAQPA